MTEFFNAEQAQIYESKREELFQLVKSLILRCLEDEEIKKAIAVAAWKTPI